MYTSGQIVGYKFKFCEVSPKAREHDLVVSFDDVGDDKGGMIGAKEGLAMRLEEQYGTPWMCLSVEPIYYESSNKQIKIGGI